MIEVNLHGNKGVAKIDDNMAHIVEGKKYYKSTAGYAVRREKVDGKWKLVLLQREILSEVGVDKKAKFNNEDTLDCTVQNLIAVEKPKEEVIEDGLQG